MTHRAGSTMYPMLVIAVAFCGCSGAGSSDNIVMSDVNSMGGIASVASTGGSAAHSSATGGAAAGGNSSSAGGTSAGKSTALGGDTGAGGRSAGTGGRLGTGGTSATGAASSATGSFDWGTTSYNPTGGSNVSHQTHDNGLACLASCHTHTFQAGGTVYATNGTTAAANVQLGIRINGTLYTAYSGSGGNFYLAISGTLDWASAQVAMRNANGTTVHPSTSGMSGNCNSSGCHDSSNRITQP